MFVYQKRADFGSRPMNGFLDDLWDEFEEVIKEEVVEAVVPPPVVSPTPAPTVIAKPAPTPVPTYTYPSVGSGLVSIQPYPMPSVGTGIIPDLTLTVQQPSVGSGIIQQGFPVLQPTPQSYAPAPGGFDFNKTLIYGGAALAGVLVLALLLRR